MLPTAFATLALAAAAPALAGDDVATTLQRQSQELVDAISHGDAAVWERYLDEAATYTTEEGEVFGKAAMVAQIKPLAAGVSGTIKVIDFKVSVHDATAIATYVDDEYEDYHGHKLHCQYRNTDTWRRTDAGWRLIGAQIMALRTDPPAVALGLNQLREYCGRYSLSAEIEYEIRCDGATLTGQRTGGQPEVLKAEAPDVLFVPGKPRYRKVLLRDAAGLVTGFAERREAWDIVWNREREAAFGVPRFDHVLIVVLENRAFAPIIGNPELPYINALAAQGANFTQSFAIGYPSQPNYLALFSGSTQGVQDNHCPRDFVGRDNLASQLLAAHLTFAGYSEDQPEPGYTGCAAGQYVRKHNPWINFDNVPRTASLPLSALPADYSKLPTVAFVVPNLCNDMHDCAPSIGDAWLKERIERYLQWAKSHNSLLILTFDEDDHSGNNRIPTLFVGAHVKPGDYAESIDHYRVLATLEAMYGLRKLGEAAPLQPITSVWKPE